VTLARGQKGLWSWPKRVIYKSAGGEEVEAPQGGGYCKWDAAVLVARACIGVPAERNVLALLKQEETVGG
jgi:hypothetical protein